jgi:hypothetical protein
MGVAGIQNQLARFFDQTFALRERSSTSLELLENKEGPSLIHSENSLAAPTEGYTGP